MQWLSRGPRGRGMKKLSCSMCNRSPRVCRMSLRCLSLTGHPFGKHRGAERQAGRAHTHTGMSSGERFPPGEEGAGRRDKGQGPLFGARTREGVVKDGIAKDTSTSRAPAGGMNTCGTTAGHQVAEPTRKASVVDGEARPASSNKSGKQLAENSQLALVGLASFKKLEQVRSTWVFAVTMSRPEEGAAAGRQQTETCGFGLLPLVARL